MTLKLYLLNGKMEKLMQKLRQWSEWLD